VRTRFFDDALRDATVAGCRQVVLLAAGLDTRAFRLDWSAGTSLFELDVADVLAFKECVLAANGARPRCERIVVTADLREDWPAALRGAGFSSAQPSAWLAEGILMYLDEAERDALLSAIGALSASGSHLALELPVWRLSAEVGESMARGVVRRADFARVAAAAQSAPAGDADPSVADPGAWLAGHGWRPSIFAVAKRFAAYGRAAPALFSTLATSSPPRRLAIAHVA
jgi:methyltransferase (TIGR00027 family)